MATPKTIPIKEAKAKVTRKPRAVKKPESAILKKTKEHLVRTLKPEEQHPEAKAESAVEKIHEPKTLVDKGRYIFATGRRKTAIANIRLFQGKGELVVNKKPLKSYFQYSFYQEQIIKPFQLTGLGNSYHFTVHVSGGGQHSQAQAVQHGLTIALAKASPEHRQILKKNGLLTRDDRKKERKKPGLKRARRAPQWAKR